MDIGIIGGGASGMILASKIKNNNVTLIEKNSKLGKKLLITGNGKCNFTNDDFSDLSLIYNNEFALKLVKRFDNKSFINFFNEIGIEEKKEVHRGITYYYPNSNKSTSVYYNLIDKINDNKVNIKLNSEVKDIKFDNNKFVVIVNDGDNLVFDKIVIATGGKSYSITGSDGFGYSLAKLFNHNIVEPLPALCGLKYSDNDLKDLKGVRIDAIVNAWDEVNGSLCFLAKEEGEIQFNDYGVSGIPVMNLSRIVNRKIFEKHKIVLFLNISNNFAPNIKKATESMVFKLNDRKKNIFYKKASDFLCGYVPDELARVILSRSKVKFDNCVSEITDENIKLIAKNLLNFRIDVKGYTDFNNAQVTIGGVDTSEINEVNLESKLQKGLYFIGEVLDIDGRCGGYNLQLAYATASIVADNI